MLNRFVIVNVHSTVLFHCICRVDRQDLATEVIVHLSFVHPAANRELS